MNNRLSVLILDDDPDDIYLAREALMDVEETSYTLDTAYNPAEAEEFLKDNQYDLILCDYRLGPVTGIDFIKSLRSRKIETPIILLTGISGKAIDDMALEAGAADYINKSDISGPLLDKAIRYAVAHAARQNLLSAVLAHTESAICVTDEEGIPQLWNSQFEEAAKQRSEREDGADLVGNLASVALASGKSVKIGNAVLEKTAAELQDGRVVLTMHDVTNHIEALRERKEAESRLEYLANHCSLTGLPNRLQFADKIKQMIDAGLPFQLLNLDLDNFKDANDVFGHEVGDELLKQVTKRLKECIGEGEFLSRIGGDEFIILCEGSQTANDRKFELAECIKQCLSRDFHIDGRTMRIGVSVGISSYPEHGTDQQTLLSNADVAMYRAKAVQQSSVQIYDQELDEAVRERRVLLRDLTEALKSDELEVYFHPLVDVASTKIVCFEALARWNRNGEGFVSPELFISIAEENGLIETLGDQILNKACMLAAKWPLPVKVSVNVSGVQIRHTDIVHQVQSALFMSGLAAHRLEIEVTESILLDDFEHSIHTLRGLKALGVSLAMDDFGTGFSSLSSLISFPFDKLKIDRSFVMELDTQPRLKNVVKTCIGLGKNLNLKIVAEGVERRSHVEFLQQEGCQEMQGFLFGKPMSQADVLDYLTKGQGWAIFNEEFESYKAPRLRRVAG